MRAGNLGVAEGWSPAGSKRRAWTSPPKDEGREAHARAAAPASMKLC